MKDQRDEIPSDKTDLSQRAYRIYIHINFSRELKSFSTVFLRAINELNDISTHGGLEL